MDFNDFIKYYRYKLPELSTVRSGTLRQIFSALVLLLKDSIDSSQVFSSDLVVNLMNGKTFGKYMNGQTIPSKGKTVKEVIEMAVIEYMTPSFSTFTTVLEQIYEVSVEISGSTRFFLQYNNIQNISPNTLTIKDLTSNIELLTNSSIQSIKYVDIGIIKKYSNRDINQWRAYFKDTNNITYESPIISVIWKYKTFHGSVDNLPVTSNDVRSLNQIWESENNFQILLNKTKYTIAVIKDKSILSIITQNNEPIKSNFIKRPQTLNIKLGDSVTTAEYDIYDFESGTVMNLTANVILL